MKKLWKFKSIKAWLIVMLSIVIILVTASTVVTKTPFLSNTMNNVFGGEYEKAVKGDPSQYQYYTGEYKTKQEALDAADILNEQIVDEGIVLLKNDDNILPMAKDKKVTIMGKNSVNMVVGGSGSSAGVVSKQNPLDFYETLDKEGVIYNKTIKEFYDNNSKSGSGRSKTPAMGDILTGFKIGETPLKNYPNSVKESYSEYNDLAIVVITRIGGEGYDLPRTMYQNGNGYLNWEDDKDTQYGEEVAYGKKAVDGARSVEDHYLQLDQNETDLLKEANDNFDNVVVLINSTSTMELGFLDDPSHYAYQPNIKGALWVGSPGSSGISSIVNILLGKANPSGKTANLYARDFKKDPTWNNFGNNLNKYGNRLMLEDDNSLRNAYIVEHEEGIYTGYRYYETRGFTDGENWYKDNVVYPLGYGLSYTEFDWEIVGWNHEENEVATTGKDITVDIKVTNNGVVAGKDVVQLYFTSPYYDGEIEKSHVILGDFKKTKLLEPSESQIVTLDLPIRDMASYDYNDANNNGFKGYELDFGTYEIKIMKNSHEVFKQLNVQIDQQRFEYDETTNTKIENLFDDVSEYVDVYLSRDDWDSTWPTIPTREDLTVSQDFLNKMSYIVDDKEKDPWYNDDMPNQETSIKPYDETNIKLYELIGKSYNDPLWDKLLDYITVSQMRELITQGSFKTLNIPQIGKPLTIDADGPMGFALFMGSPVVYDTAYYASELVLGSTWNVELANQMGLMIGNEGILGNQKQSTKRPYSGWYAPAMNVHRSQFGGRNFEYYSEDPYLSGKMASEVIKGAMEKGVYTYAKHFALNSQETRRDVNGLLTFANEQSMREIYFKPFEIAVKEGGTTAMMSSFNRIGTEWAGGSHNLLTKLLRDEWGFNGMVITDFNLTTYMNIDQMIRAGGDLSLSPSKNMSTLNTPTEINALRKATKNILYTVANSNAMNGFGEGVVYDVVRAPWITMLIISNVIIYAGLLTWGGFVIYKGNKRIKLEERNEKK